MKLDRSMIYKDLIELDLDVKTQNEFFEYIAAKLLAKGLVRDTFLESIKAREANYPTGLEVEPYPIAIPHTMAEHIVKPFVVPVRLKNTVRWGEMGTDDQFQDVKFIFLLGFLKGGAHVDLLQLLMYNFQKPETMERLLNAKTVDEYEEIVLSMEPDPDAAD